VSASTYDNTVGINPDTIKKLGWSVGPNKLYARYSARPSRRIYLGIVVDRSGRQPVVHIEGMK